MLQRISFTTHLRCYNRDIFYVTAQWSRRYSVHRSSSGDENVGQEPDEAYKRQRKTEWKRRQRGQTFLDHLIVTIRAGKGGNGCVAFHREKFVPYGPPSGGNGGKGSDVYILPTAELTTLSSVPKRIRGMQGAHGKGTWMHGRNGPPTIIKVPIGTIVREITRGDPRRATDEFEAELEALQSLSPSERTEKMRERRWVHYPGSLEDNVERDAFLDAEKALLRHERTRRQMRLEEGSKPFFLDLDSPALSSSEPVVSGSEIVHQAVEGLGYLVATGGEGGIGNPAFVSTDNRSPKFATRGSEGQRITLSLELKILADIGLVGYPNAGKSTLLRSLTGGRAKTEVASYSFTTLNPVVGVVRLDDNCDVLGNESTDLIVEETKIEEQQLAERIKLGELSHVRSRNQVASMASITFNEEAFRFTVADNPGLIADSSENVGLGHSFLRSIERSLALVYVVDFSESSPEKQLHVLRQELESFKPGLSSKARLVIANKADLLGTEDEASIQQAKEKLRRFEDFVQSEMRIDDGQKSRVLDVVPLSAKYSQNIRRVALLLRSYVEEARQSGSSHTPEHVV